MITTFNLSWTDELYLRNGEGLEITDGDVALQCDVSTAGIPETYWVKIYEPVGRCATLHLLPPPHFSEASPASLHASVVTSRGHLSPQPFILRILPLNPANLVASGRHWLAPRYIPLR